MTNFRSRMNYLSFKCKEKGKGSFRADGTTQEPNSCKGDQEGRV